MRFWRRIGTETWVEDFIALIYVGNHCTATYVLEGAEWLVVSDRPDDPHALCKPGQTMWSVPKSEWLKETGWRGRAILFFDRWMRSPPPAWVTRTRTRYTPPLRPPEIGGCHADVAGVRMGVSNPGSDPGVSSGGNADGK